MPHLESDQHASEPRASRAAEVKRYALTIAYDGTHFHGWQRQEPPDGAPLRTVQGVLEDTLRDLLHQRVRTIGASRTDAGVHALGQCAQFDVATAIPVDRLPLAINSRLPEDMEVREAAIAHDKFDCINDPISKRYRYRLWNHTHRPLQYRHMVWHCWVSLDIDQMNDAAQRLIGMHDFAGFAAAGHNRQSTIRTIHDCRVERAAHVPEVHIVVEGDGFLYNMVRIIAGTLFEVGRGYWAPEQIDTILREANRRYAGPTLPPQGLCLEWIRYA